jgi:hypothetical protein
MDTLLTQLVDFIKSASPILWETLIRQVKVESFIFSMWTLALFGISIAFYLIGKAIEKHDTHGYDDFEKYSVWVFSGMSLLGAFAFMTLAISRLLNPTYYAIMMIVNQLH